VVQKCKRSMKNQASTLFTSLIDIHRENTVVVKSMRSKSEFKC
jgi:hypothetical protein